MIEQQTFAFRPVAAAAPARENLVIEAGAGTGKTTAIVGEVLKLLFGGVEITPERIVLVTFTEKAAGEIADRIHGALEDIRHQADRNQPVRWPAGSEHPLFEAPPSCRGRAEEQLARIDALRSQTIHSFCQSLLRQYPIEAGIDPQFRIIEGFDRSLFYDQVFDDWVDHETRVQGRADAAREWEALLEHRTYFFFARADIFELLERRHLLLDESYDIGCIAEYDATLRSAVEAVRLRGNDDHDITRYFRTHPAPEQGSAIDDWIDYFAPIAGALRSVHLKQFPACKDALKEVLRGEDTKSCVYDLLVSHRAAGAALSLTRRFVDYLDAAKRARGVLDFDDLLLRTRALLQNDSILARVRAQFDFIFVDEFQDTDRIQADILRLIATDSSGHFVPGKIAVVGDPKQSIYAFRRADPETYASFTSAIRASGGGFEYLEDQYRSRPELVAVLNDTCETLFANGERDPNVFQPEYHRLRAARNDEADCAPWLFLDGGGNAEKEAEAIVAWIREQNEPDLRRFALLFRRRTKMETYLDVFDRCDLPYVVPPLGLFLDRPAAVDLLAVLRAIAYGYDRGALISAARTPYFALTDVEIASGLLAEEDGPWKELIESLKAFRRASRHLTVTELVDHVIAATNIEAVYRATSGGDRALRHLEQVRAIAFTYDRKAGGSLRQFVEETARRREAPEEVEPSLLDETTNAVRILTIHGAKGLEFDRVIVPDLEFSTHGQGVDVFTVEEPRSLVMRNGFDTLSGVCRSSDGRPLKDIGKLRDQAEMRRLFYVAITRAKSQVVVVARPKVTNNGFGRFIKEIFGDALPCETMCGPAFAGRPAEAGPHTDLAPCVIPHVEPVVDELSAAEVRIARAGAANRGAGILLHRALERWDGASDVAPLIDALAAEQAAGARAIDLVRKRIVQVAGSTTFRRVLSAETIGREMPVAFLDENGSLVERRIDRLIRENGDDIVVDYKSGEPGGARVERDREQVALYCRLIGEMTGRPCRGLLWYIDVDNDVAIDV